MEAAADDAECDDDPDEPRAWDCLWRWRMLEARRHRYISQLWLKPAPRRSRHATELLALYR
jgi:hypothetical protein